LKLLYILSEYLPDSGGGIITHYARMLPQLVRRGHAVKVILASTGKLDHPTYEVDGVCVEPLQSRFLEKYKEGFTRWAGLDIFYYMLPVAWAAWAQAQENFDYDLVEVTDWALLFLPWVAAEKRAPVVVSLHGSCGQVDWFGKCEPRSLDGDLVRMVEAAALRGADVVHANSCANAEFWQEKTGREIQVIPPAYGGGTKADLTTDYTDKLGLQKGMATPGEPELALSFQNPFTSELAQDSENTSPTCSAIGPAGAICADDGGIESVGGNQLADSAGFLAGQSQAGLPMDNQKLPYIRTANDLIASGEFSASVPIREIRGFHSAPLDAPGLVVGRLQNWKGAEVLCKALRLAPEIEIEWAGGDTDWGTSGMKASEYLAANYPDVFGKRFRWIGRLDREKVAEKMQAAAFLVVPSLWDVFNLTVAEGMEAGLPMICSRAAGAEMLIQHGISGFLFDPAKPEELAGYLKQILEMSPVERNEMARNSQEAIKNLLGEDKILNLMEKSYGDAIKRGVTTSKDAWLASLLLAGAEQVAQPKLNLAQRAIRKAERILANV